MLTKHFLGRQRLFVIEGLTSAAGEELNGRLGETQHVDKRTGRLAVRMLPGDQQANWKLLRHHALKPSPLQVLEGAGACCSICLEDSSDEDGVLIRACSCRGSSGATHLGCCLKAFEAMHQSKTQSLFPTCPTCKSPYHPKVAVTLLLAHASAHKPNTSGGGGSARADGLAIATTTTSAPIEPGCLVRLHSLITATHLNGRRGLAIERDARSTDGRWLVQMEDSSLKALREANLIRQSVHRDGIVRDGAAGDGGIEAAMAAAQDRLAELREGSGHALATRVLGMAYHAAGQHGMALRSLQDSIRLSEDVHGQEHPSVAVALASLGTVLLDEASAESTKRAVDCLERAVKIHESAATAQHGAPSAMPLGLVGASGPPSLPTVAYASTPITTLLALARAYRLRGDAAAGHALLLQCLSASEARAAPPRVASSSSDGNGDGGGASGAPPSSRTHSAAPTSAVSAPREASEALAVVLEELASSEAHLADDAARRAVDECCSSIEALLAKMAAGESNGAEGLAIPEAVADAKRRDGARAAAEHLARALALRERTHGPRHEALVGLLLRLGNMWMLARKPRLAAPVLERAVDLALSVSSGSAGGADGGGSTVAELLSRLKGVYEELGESAKADQALQRATALYRDEARAP